jgi:hypothetical protein
MKRHLLLLILFCGWTTSAFASPPISYTLDQSGPHQDLKDRTLYEVKFSCKRGAGLSDDSNVLHAIANFFVHPNESANQYMVISNDMAVPDPSDAAKIKLPEKAITILPVFSIKNTTAISNFSACEKSIYVQSTQRIYLIPTVAWSKKYTEGGGLAALYQATKLISPLWSLFNPASIPAAIASKIANAQATEDPIKAILTAMNNDSNYGENVRLRTGRYIINTKYSTVTVTVSPLSSIVSAASDELRQDFRSALDSATKIETTNFTGTCSQIGANLEKVGFSREQDVPYALAYLAANALSQPIDIIHCLGRDYAVRAAKLGPILWSNIPESRFVSEQAASDVYPPSLAGGRIQPDFSTIDGALDNFVRSLSRVAKNQGPDGVIPSNYIADLKGEMTPTVVINDKTDAGDFLGVAPVDSLKLGVLLTGKGFFRFGCYAQITAEKFGNNPDGAVAMFIMFRAAKDASSTPLATAVGVRPFFDRGLISQLTITDRRQWITAVLDANAWNCNGTFEVKKPTVATAMVASPR